MDRIDSKTLCRLEHPGLVLANFIEPYGISQNSLARSMGVSPRRINEILQGKRAITADTAIGLAEVFRNGPLFWMRLQARVTARYNQQRGTVNQSRRQVSARYPDS